MILIFLITLILLYIFFKIFLRKEKAIADNIPGPKTIPIFGNAFEFLKNEDPLYTLFRFTNKYGNIYKLWLGSDLYVIMSDPADIQTILGSSKYNKKALSYKFVSSWLGNGLITSYGNIWHSHRKLLTPTFHFKILENSIEIIYNSAKIMCQELENKIGTEEFDIQTYIEKCSLDIICEIAMGIKMNVQTSQAIEYFDAVKNVTSISAERIFKKWLQSEILFKFTSYYKTFQKSLQVVENTSKQVINSKRQKVLQQINESGKNDTESITRANTPTPFLDLLLTESNFTDEEIHDEVKSFMFAGHDTTTAAISFCIYQLANHGDVQDKVHEEIMRILGLPAGNNLPSIQDLGNLKYLQNVINETLRLYPSVPMIGRTLEESVKLPSGYTLPMNSNINIFVYGVHRNSNIFENPNEFIPERFNDNKNRHTFSYIPFSAGSRNCIGQKLAILEIKIVLTTLLRNYILLPVNKTKSLTLTSKLILRPKDGIPVCLKERSS